MLCVCFCSAFAWHCRALWWQTPAPIDWWNALLPARVVGEFGQKDAAAFKAASPTAAKAAAAETAGAVFSIDQPITSTSQSIG